MLNLAYQLEERCHDTKGDNACTQLQTAPDESDEIAQAEGKSQNKTRDDGETCATQDTSHQLVLHIAESSCYPLFTA